MAYEFDIGSDANGRIRISVFVGEAEPVYLPGAARAHGGPLWNFVRTAVRAAPSVESDEDGLYWTNRGDAESALGALRE